MKKSDFYNTKIDLMDKYERIDKEKMRFICDLFIRRNYPSDDWDSPRFLYIDDKGNVYCASYGCKTTYDFNNHQYKHIDIEKSWSVVNVEETKLRDKIEKLESDLLLAKLQLSKIKDEE